MIEDNPGESKSQVSEWRLSGSKSGFTEQNFILVFKRSDGTYTTPRKIPREVALQVARDPTANQAAAKSFSISKSVAKFILAKALRDGLIIQAANERNFDLEDFAMDSVLQSGQTLLSEVPTPLNPPKIVTERQPKYFPVIDPYQKPDFTTSMIDVIGYILSGVDPSQLKDPRVIQRDLSLRTLVQTSAARVSAGLWMQEDHWYVLANFHHFEREAFKLAWEEAQSQASGQANTDVVKLMTTLDKFKIDSAAKCLEDASNKSLFVDVQDKSIEMLSRIFRRIRRKIESINEQQVPEAKRKKWFDHLLKRKPVEQQSASLIQPEVRRLVTEYLKQSIKIGRILRSEVLRQHR